MRHRVTVLALCVCVCVLSYHSLLFYYYFRMSTTPTKKKVRSEEARKRRNQKKKQKDRSREDSPKWPYLLPMPCVPCVHYDYVTIDCEMVVVEARTPSEKLRLALVSIMDKNGVPVYDTFVPPSSGCRINKRSRWYCPVTDQQFEITRRCENTDFDHVRSEVLDILRRYIHTYIYIYKQVGSLRSLPCCMWFGYLPLHKCLHT